MDNDEHVKRMTVEEYIRKSKEIEKKREIEGNLDIARQIQEEDHENNMNFIYWVIIFLVIFSFFK